MGLATAGVDRLYIDDTGKVGIGTGTPLVPLEVNGEIRGSRLLAYGSG